MITYLSRFIPNLASLTAPIRTLLEKNAEWTWDQQHQQAFEKLKQTLKRPPVLGYFNRREPVLLSVDASSPAVGRVLIQNEKPIAYTAKALTKSQKNYSQLEKEVS